MTRVLYVSKAMVVRTYRDKLEALGRRVDLSAVIPENWGGAAPEWTDGCQYAIRSVPVRFSGSHHLHFYRRLGGLIDDLRPDLVHIDEEPYSAVTLQLAALCRRRRLPAIFFAWQNLDKRLPPPFGRMRSFVFGAVAGAIAGTEDAATVLRRAGYQGPLSVIPQLGVDEKRFASDADCRHRMRARIGVSDTAVVVGYCGRLVREKGVHVLLDAAVAVPKLHLVIVGDGPERARLELLAPHATFVGAVPSTEVPAWLSALDVLVLPSLSQRGWVEQFGRVLVEGMACGVAVVGSDSGEIPNVIGDAGLIVPEGDAAALRHALERLAASSALRSTLAQCGRARVLDRFTQDRVANETVSFYRHVLSGAGPS